MTIISTRKEGTVQQKLNLLLKLFLLFHLRNYFGWPNSLVHLGFNAYLLTRYSTKFEIFLNAIGLVAAAAAGATQVCLYVLVPNEGFTFFL